MVTFATNSEVLSLEQNFYIIDLLLLAELPPCCQSSFCVGGHEEQNTPMYQSFPRVARFFTRSDFLLSFVTIRHFAAFETRRTVGDVTLRKVFA